MAQSQGINQPGTDWEWASSGFAVGVFQIQEERYNNSLQ